MEDESRGTLSVWSFLNGPVPRLVQPLFLGCTVVYLYLQQFALPWTPILLAGDPGIFLAEAQRMLRGEMPYRDFFQFLTPGIDVVYYLLFRIFGPSAFVVSASLVAAGLCATILMLHISRRVLRGWLVFLPPLLYLTLTLSRELQAVHHLFSALAVMAAVGILIEQRTPKRLALAGVFCAIASFFTQTRGLFALAGLAAFVLWEGLSTKSDGRAVWRREAALVAAYAVVLAALLLPFARMAGLRTLVDSIVVFPVRYYGARPCNNASVYLSDPVLPVPWWRFPLFVDWVLLHALLPLAYVLGLFRFLREREQKERPAAGVMLMCFVGIALCAEVARSPSYHHLQWVSFPVFIVLAWLVRGPGRANAGIIAALAALALLFLIPGAWRVQHAVCATMRLPVGNVAFRDRDYYDQCAWLASRTRPGDFLMGDGLLYLFALGLRNPARVGFLTATAYTRPDQIDDVLQKLKQNRVRFVIFDPSECEGQSLEAARLRPVCSFICEHYRRVPAFLDLQVWELR